MNRPLLHEKVARRLVVHLRSHDVRRQQIRSELNSAERRVDRLGERAHRERLREPRHALEQHVAAREKTDEQSLDHVLLSHNAAGDLSTDVADETGINRGLRRLRSGLRFGRGHGNS